MRVGLDGTPLLGSPTGVGRYTAGLAAGLATLPDGPTVRLVPFSWRGATELAAAAAAQLGPVAGSARVETTARRVPARALRALWMHAGLPPVEWLAGAIEVFHGTNYLLPPTRRAAGVVTIHDLTYLHHPEWVNAASRAYRELVPVALRRAAVVTTVSATVRDELLEAYPRLDPDRVLVTPNGVEPAAVERASVAPAPGAALPRPAGLPADYLLFLGTVEPRKGLDTVLEAYRSSSTTLPPLVVAGAAGWGGPSQGAEDAGAGGQVIRLGYVDAATARTLLAGATALVFPSRYEGFGLPPLEALAQGTPAVVSDLPVLREVCGELATFVAADDPQAWAHALGRVAAEGDGGPTARAARRAHAATFSWARCARAAQHAYGVALAVK